MVVQSRRADVEARLQAICEKLNKRYPMGRHSFGSIAPFTAEAGVGTNWQVNVGTIGTAGPLSEFQREVDRVRGEMPLIDPAEL